MGCGRIFGVLVGMLLSATASAAQINHYYYSNTIANQACLDFAAGLSKTCTNSGSYRRVNTGDGNYHYFFPYYNEPTYCDTWPYSVSSEGTNWQKGECSTNPYTEPACTAAGLVLSAGSCIPAPPACTGGQVMVGGVCSDDPCTLGNSWDELAQQCEWPDVPPESCGEGEISAVNSSGAVIGCAPVADIDESCDYSAGYGADGFFLCGGQKSECEAAGGTHGYVDGSEVCIPDDYSPPICDSTQVAVLSAGGFVCSTPSPVKPQDSNDVKDPSSPPTLPGETSTTPSGQSAAPGTGTSGGGSGGTGTPGAPAPEADEGTLEAGKTGQGRASADCAAPPVCSGGDPQMCALLRQQWETMCAQPDMLEKVDGNQASVIGAKLDAGIDAVFTGTTASDVTGTVAADSTGGVGSSAEMGWFDGFVSDLVPSGSSCSSYSMNMPRVVLTFGCERLDWLKSFLGWMLYCYTVFFVWGTVFAPYRSPAGGE